MLIDESVNMRCYVFK